MEKLSVHNLKESWAGFQSLKKPRNAQRPPGWNAKLADFISLAENRKGLPSLLWQHKLKETMGSDDFPTLFGDITDRLILTAYTNIPKQMRQICRIARNQNMKQVRRSRNNGLVRRLQEVAEGAPYESRAQTVDHFTYTPRKFGARVDLTWEAWINDDLGFFGNIANDLAASAVNTEEFLLTSLFWDSAGPIETYFNVTGIGQDGVSVLPLTAANLSVAIAEMSGATTGFRNVEGEPVANRPAFLVVPPALEFTAKAILNASRLGPSGNATPTLIETLMAEQGLTLIIEPWIPVIVTTGTLAATTWALFSGTVDSCELGMLAGHESPELFMKNPNAQRLGGGMDPFDGDFETDEISWKVRHIQGETSLDERGGWASDGQ